MADFDYLESLDDPDEERRRKVADLMGSEPASVPWMQDLSKISPSDQAAVDEIKRRRGLGLPPPKVGELPRFNSKGDKALRDVVQLSAEPERPPAVARPVMPGPAAPTARRRPLARRKKKATEEAPVEPPPFKPVDPDDALEPSVSLETPERPGFTESSPKGMTAMGGTRAEQRTQVSSEFEATQDARREIQGRAAESEQQMGEVRTDEAQLRAEQAAAAAELQQEQAAAEDQLREDTKRITDAAQARKTAADEAFSKFKFQDFWADKSASDKVLRKVGVALGFLAQGIRAGMGLNTGNNVLAKLQDEIRQDFKLQQARYQKLSDEQAMARTGVDDANHARALMQAELAQKHAAAARSVAGKFEALLAKAKVPAEQIATDQRVQALQLQANEQDKAAAALYNTVTSEQIQSAKMVARQGFNSKAIKITNQVRQAMSGDETLKVANQAAAKVYGMAQAERQLAEAFKSRNPKLMQSTITQALVIINGGVLSDSERTSMAERSGGLLQQGADGVLKWAGGMPTDQTVKDFMGTLQGIRKQANETARIASDAVMTKFAIEGGQGGVMPGQIVRQFLPALPRPAETAMQDPQAAKAWIEANPDDPRAAPIRSRLQLMGAL